MISYVSATNHWFAINHLFFWSLYPSVSPSVCLSTYLSAYLSIRIFVFLNFCPPICLCDVFSTRIICDKT